MIFKKIGNMENVEAICHYFGPISRASQMHKHGPCCMTFRLPVNALHTLVFAFLPLLTHTLANYFYVTGNRSEN
jgi:hypothetical protein